MIPGSESATYISLGLWYDETNFFPGANHPAETIFKNISESQTLNFQFYAKSASVSYTDILYIIQSNRVENAPNASMPLHSVIFTHWANLLYNVRIVQCSL